MKPTGILLLIFLVVLSFLAHAQKAQPPKRAIVDVSANADCSTPLWIVAQDRFDPTSEIVGHGVVQEIANRNYRIPHYLESEHNSVWYGLIITSDGELLFDVIPVQATDDYDFMLFRYITGLCNAIQNGTAIPVRSCISRVDSALKGMTGLSNRFSEQYIRSGPGASYVGSVQVNAGDSLLLIVDNVYANGKGHFLKFRTLDVMRIRGSVIDDITGKPIEATVALLSEGTEDTIAHATTDKKGFYEMIVNRNPAVPNFNLSIEAPGYFFSDTLLEQDKITEAPLPVTKLPKLLVGRKIRVNNINFKGGLAVPIEGSRPVFKRLLRLMKRNSSLVILIEGHVNGCRDREDVIQKLSEDRAQCIKQFLEDNGIDASRIETKGHGCKHQLFPESKDLREQQLNRRVEFTVKSI